MQKLELRNSDFKFRRAIRLYGNSFCCEVVSEAGALMEAATQARYTAAQKEGYR